ncbi:outer membrane beta-barrel protein [Spirosoma sp. KUDC1026]|uniref:outer membrane beta-barrel protein n=1 Tax=Spirosoma sp. KUDC1026 TaxID=2745947 RepID=UPI00159BA751|nr:outer membrane beta-barrel protein [Spirosoma sp. KUDC1026]QKZ12463.1 outer membrane beta-barrel protein [Spirosoma sp. KUDC1026]
MKTFKHFLIAGLFTTTTATFAQTTTTTITVSTNGDTTTTTTTSARPKKAIERVASNFTVYLGLNNFGSNLADGYDLKPLGSRYIALAWQQRIPLISGGKTKLRLITGPEVAWNNFMFEGRNVLTERDNQLVIESAAVDLHRSKLVTTQLNLPLLLNLSLRSGFSFSAGAYAGMRLDSYTKVKPEGGKAVRDHGDYNLKPFRWGLTAELGFRGHTKLFGRYEPQSIFRPGLGPDASVWSVGIKL